MLIMGLVIYLSAASLMAFLIGHDAQLSKTYVEERSMMAAVVCGAFWPLTIFCLIGMQVARNAANGTR